MKYKGYIGKTEYDRNENIFTASVVNADVVITGQGKSKEEAELMLAASIDDYLKWCEEDGVSPEKPFSGRFNVRIQPSLHQQAVVAAKSLNLSLNGFIEKSVRDEVAMCGADF